MSSVWLFASRARPTSSSDSDVDLATSLHGEISDVLQTSLDMADDTFDILLDTGVNIHPMPISLTDWLKPLGSMNPELIGEVKRDGIEVRLP